MHKSSIYSDNSNNRLSYLDKYDEINNFKKKVKKKKKSDIILSKMNRWIIFILFFITAIIVNMDHGTVPAATREIKIKLDIDNNTLGIFGSLVFLGNLLGSLFSLTLINCINRKCLLLMSLMLNAICLYTFTITNIYWILLLNRIFVGIFQAFISIYLPVWCDQFGPGNKKTMMISLIQAGSPIGVVFGYYLTAFVKDGYGWTHSFVIQSIAIAVLSIFILLIPSIYFSNSLGLHMKSKILDKNMDICEVSIYRENTSDVTTSSKPKKSFFYNISIILKKKVFIFSALSLSNLFFIITAVQYWASDYLADVLHIENKEDINLSFIIVCVTSPTLGVIFGGIVSSRIGGYESKHSILLCLILALFAGAFSIPVPIMNDILSFTIFLWLVLFFGGAILPPLTGIIITSLPINLRGSANSITSIFSNLFGYLPAPFVYGCIYEYTKKTSERFAFSFVMYYSFLGFILLTIASYFRYKHFKDIKEFNNLLLLNERKFSSRRSSIYTDSVAKIFGSSCVNMETDYEYNFLTEENDNEEKPFNYKVFNEENTTNGTKIASPSMITPHFMNVGSSDMEYLKLDKNSSHIFVKDESIFGYDKAKKSIESISISDGFQIPQSMNEVINQMSIKNSMNNNELTKSL